MNFIPTVVVLILTAIFYAIYVRYQKLRSQGAARRKNLVVLFIDAPDPDNYASAAAVSKHVLANQAKFHQHLHIVLTGRPVNLKTSKAPSGVLLLESIARHGWEENNPMHAKMVLEDAAVRLENYLAKCNIDVSTMTIYDGGVAPCAPISDKVHDWDFLFDRKDLASGEEGDRGNILTPQEYSVLVEEVSALSEEEREDKLSSYLRPYPLVSLSALRTELEQDHVAKVVLFLGGPATALVQLLGGSNRVKLRSKVTSLYGMFGALKPGSGMLPNQFNVACDVEAACNLFIDNLLPRAEKYLITTETAKSKSLILSSQDLQGIGIGSYFVNLQRLWESTHGGSAQPLFDVLPVMAFLEPFRVCFKWSRKKAVLRELQRQDREPEVQQIFCFADTDNHEHPLVSEPTHSPSLNKATFLDFMRQTWEPA